MNLDPATLAVINEMVKTTPGLTASNTYRLTYRIPFIPPRITEPLRTRCLVPVPHHDAPPKVTLNFASTAAMYGAGTLDTVLVQFIPVRREVPAATHDDIMKKGGYLPFDLVENKFDIAPGIFGEQHIPINQPGYYANLCLRLYKGGASITRDDMSASTTVGSETVWKIMTSNKVYREFAMKGEQIKNGWARVLNSSVQSSSPTIAGKLAANTQFGPPNSVLIDFLTGNGVADVAELGGCLDCFLPANPGQRMELVGSVASVITNASTIYMIGHRFTDKALTEAWMTL
jgi:hypothetical protein